MSIPTETVVGSKHKARMRFNALTAEAYQQARVYDPDLSLTSRSTTTWTGGSNGHPRWAR